MVKIPAKEVEPAAVNCVFELSVGIDPEPGFV